MSRKKQTEVESPLAAHAPLRLEYLDPSTLKPHEKNWKEHGPEQREALDALIGDVGWAGALLLNERTGKLLDGHGRRAQAIDKGERSVPVLIGSWDEGKEEKILALLDPTGSMFGINARALNDLLSGNSALDLLAADSPAVGRVMDALRDASSLLNDPEVKESDKQIAKPVKPKRPTAGDVPDAVWADNNPWGVPVLDLSLQADAVEFPVAIWGTQGQTKAMRGTWAFYTADETFRPIWENPGKVFPSGAPCLTELNFSTHDQTPFAVALYDIYRKRWLSRYWQSQGKRIFVDINVHHDLLAPHEATKGQIPAFLGVPKMWRAFSTRAHANRPEMLIAEHDIALEYAEVDSLLFLVYGGGYAVRDLCRERGWNWVPEQSDTARGKFVADAGGEA